MTLKFLLLAVLGLASVTADFNATASLDFSANALDQANCVNHAYGYDATTHDASAIERPGALWNDFEGGDYSGFVYGGTGEFGLTIAIPTLYEAEMTTLAFQDADTAASDMTSAISADDSWKCSTCQAWYGNGNAPIDADTCTEDAFGDCFAVFRYKKSWALFTADMGIGLKNGGKGLERIEYGTEPSIGTEGVAFNGGGGVDPVTGLAPQKFIEFCGEMVVTMWEVPVNGWPQETSSFSADAVTIARHVTDRFVFCLVFQTPVAVSTDLTIHDQPDYFQLLRIQDNACSTPTTLLVRPNTNSASSRSFSGLMNLRTSLSTLTMPILLMSQSTTRWTLPVRRIRATAMRIASLPLAKTTVRRTGGFPSVS